MSVDIVAHDHVAEGARDNTGAERLVLAAAAGRSALVARHVSPVLVLEELQFRLWVRSDLPGVRLAARVVLPRSIDRRTGAARFAIVRGGRYERPGQWQQLMLGDVTKLLANEVRVMRTMTDAAVDPREAFVDAVVLIVPGDPQGVEVLIDRLEVDGIVAATRKRETTSSLAPRATELVHPIGWWQETQATVDDGPRSAPPIRVHGTTLVVDGKPFLPRGIEWNGEPLEFLAARGFNVVQLPQLPTDRQSLEAVKHELWFVAAPPRPNELAGSGLAGQTERVLAWFLADDAAQDDPDYFRRWAELVRQCDAMDRPIVVAPQGQWAAMSRAADILVADHPGGPAMAAADFDQWLGNRPRLARPGTAVWARIPTQLGIAAAEQMAALSNERALFPSVDDARVEALVRIAATRGCRGFLFQSRSSISTSDAGAKRRALLLELANARLQLLEPWLAGGKVTSRLLSQSRGSDPIREAVVLHVDHARLLMPIDLDASGERRAASSSPGNSPMDQRRVFVVPGVPDSHQVLLVSPVQLRPLEAKRVAGGTTVALEEGDEGWVLLTEDPQVIQSLRQRVVGHAARVARLERELAAAQSAEVAATGRALAQLGIATEGPSRQVAAADGMLQQADTRLTAGQVDAAYDQARAARRLVHLAAAEQRRAVPEPASLSSYPLATSDATLADHARFLQSLDKLRGGQNLLYGGDFEDLSQLLQFGWQHVHHPAPGVEAHAELSAVAPHDGTFCLQLSVRKRGSLSVEGGSTNSEARNLSESVIVDDAPVWIVSPAIPVNAGQLVEITGWVRVPESIRGSVDGLQIVDSLGGSELALSIRETTSWQPFRIIRAVPEATELRVSFVLTGIGSAQVDSVMVHELRRPDVRRLPPVDPKEAARHQTSAMPSLRLLGISETR